MPQTALQLCQRVARKGGWPEPTTIGAGADIKSKKIIDAVNAVGVALGHYYFWPFLYRESSIITVADITAGDADVTNNSTTVTSNHASTNWTGTTGYLFKANSYSEAYRIASVGGVNSITLLNTFNGTTAIDQSYVIVQDSYNLPTDYDGALSIVQFLTPWQLDLVSPELIDRFRFGPWGAEPIVVGKPTRATIVSRDDNTDNHLFKVILDPFPDEKMVIPIKYYALLPQHTSDSATWSWPFHLEQVIVDGATARIRADGQDDSRAAFNLQEFFGSRNELAGLVPTYGMTASFQPGTGILRRAERLRRASPGRYDLGWTIGIERS